MAYRTLKLEQVDNLLYIQLARPEKLNAFSATLLSELRAAIAATRDDQSVSVIIIKAFGKAFTVGYDLNESDWVVGQYPANFPEGVDREQDREDIQALLDGWLEIWAHPKPIITQVQGLCLSGGGELLAVSDLVVASSDARFGHPAGRDLGIPPTVFFWPMLIGMRKTKELLYTAKLIDAGEAERIGLINQVTTPQDLDATVTALAEDIARTPVENLAILKASANCWAENMNMVSSSRMAADLDADFHQSDSYLNFFRLVKEQGMQAALADRRKRFD